MDSTSNSDVEFECPSVFRRYKDGRIERLTPDKFVPPSPDPQNGAVCSKDITITAETGLSARLYLPSKHLLAANSAARKLPLLIYFHGGGFIISTPFDPLYHPYVTKQVRVADAIAVSVHYRRAPEDPIPAAYVDSKAAIQWVASHNTGSGPDPWLNRFADFGRVVLGGDSSGANIAHNMALSGGDLGLTVNGLMLVHPFFWAGPIGGEAQNKPKEMVDSLWPVACPDSLPDDPRINPMAEGAPSLAGLRCSRVLVCVAGKESLRDQETLYFEALKKSRWTGVADIHVTENEGHVFHLMDLEREVSQAFLKTLADFINVD